MSAPTLDESRRAVVIHPSDSVAVALEPLEPGPLQIRRGDEVLVVPVREPIPMGHKLALLALAAGDAILKYGEVIGVAIASISAGAHVHVHNLRSRRAGAGSRAEQNDPRSL